MRKKIAFLFPFLLAVVLVHGQAKKTTDTVDLSDLYTPASPGFVLMDKAPGSVEKPTTTKAFEADVLALAQGGAIQVTPFWLKNHPNLQATDYTSHWSPIFETFNLSVATVKSDSNYSISLGFRTQLLRVFSFSAAQSIKGRIDKMSGLLADLGVAVVNKDTATIRKDTAAINTENKAYQKLLQRPVFLVELAGAALAVTPSSPFTKNTLSSLNKSGAWINIRYSPFKVPLDFVGVGRYIASGQKAKTSIRDSAFFDVGLALFFENKTFNISGEYVNRYDVALQKSYDRLAVALNYKISNSFVVVGSFGKNFDNVENIFAALGINFGLSKSTVQTAKPPVNL